MRGILELGGVALGALLSENLVLVSSMGIGSRVRSLEDPLDALRTGYCLTADRQLLEKMSACSQPWNVSVPAQAAALAALREPDWPAKARPLIEAQRDVLAAGLTALGLTVCRSQANYLLFRGPAGLDAALLRQKIAIRSCANYPGLDGRYFRVAIRSREENQRLLTALRQALA